MSAVTEILANWPPEEKRSLLLQLLRELAQQSPALPISIQDDGGNLLGLFAPTGTNPQDDFFAEGSPGFFRELERRQQSNNLISAEEFCDFLKTDFIAK